MHEFHTERNLFIVRSPLTVNNQGLLQKLGNLHLKNMTNKHAHEKEKQSLST